VASGLSNEEDILPLMHSFVGGKRLNRGGISRESLSNSINTVVGVGGMCGTYTNGTGCVGRRVCVFLEGTELRS
jgi:hypothetical protein